MAKAKTVYSCGQCGHQTAKWIGKCPDCDAWNSFAEERIEAVSERFSGGFLSLSTAQPIMLSDISLEEKSRLTSGIVELDRVLGGGFVSGSLVLLGGDPGIGKSTLVLQVLSHLATKGVKVLYATGEESAQQIKIRSDRLGVTAPLLVMAENSVDKIVEQVQKLKPQVLVVDSIQTVFLSSLESAPGSVSQVRESAGKLLYLSKTTGTSTILIGHVTKEGSLAGPRVLEHLVDCVLYFEGDSRQHYRILRTTKNRFGSTNEIGVFEMTQKGLGEVLNPSSVFLGDATDPLPGSTITASLEGVRPFLVEIQGLVSNSSLANPRRTTLGVDNGRVALLIAVLEKIAGLNLYMQDVYVNAAGGFKVIEPAADLAILMALVSSFRNKALPLGTLLVGEVGLTGEVRGVQGVDIRLNEAEKLGFKRAILPKSNKKSIKSSKLELEFVSRVDDLLSLHF